MLTDLEEAVRLYRTALARFGELESPENDLTPIHYNLACSLAKLGDVDAALESLARVMTDPWREDMSSFAEKDRDLEALRAAPDAARRLEQLIEAARKRQKTRDLD